MDERIRIPSGRDAVRRRPAMYFSDGGTVGLYSFVLTLLNDPLQEARLGRCSRIQFGVDDDLHFVIEDDGPPILVERDEASGLSRLELAFELGHPPPFSPRQIDPPRPNRADLWVSDISIAFANFASECMTVQTVHGDTLFEKSYRDGGRPTSRLTQRPAEGARGNTIRCRPDSSIFPPPPQGFWHSVVPYMRNFALSVPGLRVTLVHLPDGRRMDFEYPGGTLDYLRELGVRLFHGGMPPCVRIQHEQDGMSLDLGLRWKRQPSEILTLVNSVPMEEGVHIEGFRAGLKSLRRSNAGKDLAERLLWFWGSYHAVLILHLAAPEFEGARKQRLFGRDVFDFVKTAVVAKLPGAFEGLR